MDKVYRYNLPTSDLCKVEPYLNEYFGISYGYFEPEMSKCDGFLTTPTEKGESTTLNFVKEEGTIAIYLHFHYEPISRMLKKIEEKGDEEKELFKTLLLLAYIVKEQDWSWEEYNQDFVDYAQYDMVREDLLHLYIYANQEQPKKQDGQRITLKHSLGKVEIKNHDNWFTKKMLKDYLALYLDDIKSIEQAEEALLQYKKTVGRKTNDPRLPIILYGIYRMFNEKKKMKSPQSDTLCTFIMEYLQFLSILEEDTNVDNQWIRAQIKYISGKPEPPKFIYRDVMYRVDLEDLENTGKRLY